MLSFTPFIHLFYIYLTFTFIGPPQFKSKLLIKELNNKYNGMKRISNADYERFMDQMPLPDGIYDLVQLFEDIGLIGHLVNVEPITSMIKRLIELRQETINRLSDHLMDNRIKLNPIKTLIKHCLNYLKSIGITSNYYKKELLIYDEWLTQEECQTILYKIVRQYALIISFNGEDCSVLNPITFNEYERFIKNVQGGNRMECSIMILDVINTSSVYPLTMLMDDKPRYRRRCLIKKKIPTIPIRFLTSMGFHWSLCQKFNSIYISYDSDELINILKYPLRSFWIASSFNTYLSGDQLGGESTTSAISDVLLKCCRCIELNCQDGNNNDPILCHTWKNCQMTGTVTLRDALITIKETAFLNSKLPVILSFEMFCSDVILGNIAKMIREILDPHLYIPTPGEDLNLIGNLPIGNLIERIIIKSHFKSNDGVVLGQGEMLWQSMITLRTYNTPVQQGYKFNYVYSISELDFIDDKSRTTSTFNNKSPQSTLTPSCSDICFVHVHPSSTRLSSTNYCPIKPWSMGMQMVSLNYQSYDGSMLLNHGRFYNSMGYVIKPPELRINSDYDNEILDYYYHGPITLQLHVLSASQLPPLKCYNQTNYANSLSNVMQSIKRGYKRIDIYNDLYPNEKEPKRKVKWKQKKELEHAKQQGLIIEDGYNKSTTTFDDIIDKSSKIIINTTDELCPFVEVSIHGEIDKTFKTDVVNLNGYNPTWSDLTAPFDLNIKDPNISIITFKVKHYDNISSELIAQAAFPINRIRPGLRWVQLLDYNFNEIDCCGLLVHIEMKHEGNNKWW